ncbi:Type I restriction-modification system methyltransferase subunit [Lachnospiraceae bacterium NE2001]|nr:Type I restriction-modification system methyltransferase subunit [Lachnospiraceae bacterium NE2001]
MDYISVKEAAVKFELSERRVQKLCETNRIDGCNMVSGVWLIPATAIKPSDERLSEIPDSIDCISLKELCEELSISTATGRNWIKLGKLTPEYTKKKTPYFSKNYVETLRTELQSGENKALKSRRNKKFVSGNSLYNSYVSEQCKNIPTLQKLLALASDSKIVLDAATIQLLVADCALHFFISKNNLQTNEHNNVLLQFLLKELSIGEYDRLISDLIENTDFAISFCKKHPLLFNMEYIYEANEDVLGLIYISCKNIGNRKATGSYYTSTKVVKTLIDKLNFQESQKILDPCCGTGNFLLQLPEHITFDSVYGNDIDTASVKITRLNMALKYNVPITAIYDHITELDYLINYTNKDFQYIIGNPPWGYEFSEDEKSKLRSVYKSTSGKNIESYDVFIEQALNHLADNGHLAYVLPEAILNVKAHTDIRKIILESCSIKNLDFLGNAFDGVQCPCIILDLQCTHSALSTLGMNVNTGSESFTINTERTVSPEYFSFTTTDAEYNVMSKIRNVSSASYLLGNADFALGIVTGNNKEYISAQKTDSNEMVLKGADISKYHINPTNNYIIFKPESFQQIAPTEMYRAQEKLLYRFISSQLVFAYDDKQTLSLNSCNIVIPRIPGIKMKYVLAILNSRIAQFIYKRDFNSVKVLRSHIENIPIPTVDETTQDNIIILTEKLISGLEIHEAEKVYDELDILVSQVFNLNSDEFEIIKKAVDGENKFLA